MDYKKLFFGIIIIFCINSCKNSLHNDKSKNYSIKKGFYKNGNLEYIHLIDEDSLINGKNYVFDSFGKKLAEISFENGLKNGEAITYNSGLITMVENYKDDKLHGFAKYYLNGQLEEEGEYFNDKKSGIWNLYDNNKLILTEVYEKDSVIEVVYRDNEFFDRIEKMHLNHIPPNETDTTHSKNPYAFDVR